MPLIPFWKRSPFFRLLLPFAGGVCLQWYVGFSIYFLVSVFVLGFLFSAFYFFINLRNKFRFNVIAGIAMLICISSAGGLTLWLSDIRNNPKWFGHHLGTSYSLVIQLQEKPIEKLNSYKAEAKVLYLLQDKLQSEVSGKIIIYFKKDSSIKLLNDGSLLVIDKSLQEIKNAGNPGGFDYKRYTLFQQITHQVYLTPVDFVKAGNNSNAWREFLAESRKRLIYILEKNIPGEKEQGLAEALLIGYKDNLDKPLVQSYTNTGVVHIIAISGLHLGLIYVLLQWLLNPLKRFRYTRWVRPLIIILILWLFSLLAGAQPSVLRSAVMFSFLVIGESINRNGSIINSLCLSAFLLLCINPFWLWDVGFQLSYIAVLSIVLFFQPVYRWLLFSNPIVDFFWKLTAVTISAQILTVPLSIFHFHQFPVYFLLSNFWAVPLSSLVLILEILLCLFSFIPGIAEILGNIISWLIRLMNGYIQWVETLPHAIWDGLQISWLQWWTLILAIGGIAYWLMQKSKPGFVLGGFSILMFMILRSYSFINHSRQKEIIVYNVPKKTAIDFISGRKSHFLGDVDLQKDDFARNFHLKPSRILKRITQSDKLTNINTAHPFYFIDNKKIVVIDQEFDFTLFDRKKIDLLVLCKNPRVYMVQLQNAFDIDQIVFSSSAPAWKIRLWKKDCDSLQIPWHDVNTDGAFTWTMR